MKNYCIWSNVEKIILLLVNSQMAVSAQSDCFPFILETKILWKVLTLWIYDLCKKRSYRGFSQQ